MSIFDYFPDIPRPNKPIRSARRKIRIAPTNLKDTENFRWLHQKTNYLVEMMKFFPDFENLSYAGRTEDDEDSLTMWDQYGEVADVDADEMKPGHFGNVERDVTESGTPYGYVMGQKYEEVHFTPDAGDFVHIDAEKGGFADIDLFNMDQSILAGGETLRLVSDELWQEVSGRLALENRSYYEIAMDNNGGLSDYSSKDAYLLMCGMLESRTRVWLTLEELFGSFNEADDQKRIAIIDSWVNTLENDLNPENIALLSLFLDSQESFINRVSAFYGGGTEGYKSYEDKQRIPTFADNLKLKVEAYRAELVASGAEAKVNELDKLFGLWIAPAEDTDAYPNYQNYNWATTPGNILAGSDSRQVVDQVKGLVPSEYKGMREASVEIRRPDGTTFIGNPYDHIWGTHIRGVFQRLIDRYINDALTASIIGRRKMQNYKAKKEEYDLKVWDRQQWEKNLEKKKIENYNERVKNENKIKKRNKEMSKELKKIVAKAIAKKKAAKAAEARKMRARIKIHGKEIAKKNIQRISKAKKTGKKASGKVSSRAEKRRKAAYKKVFGQARKRMLAAQKKRSKKSAGKQAAQTSKRRAVVKKKVQQTRARMKKRNKNT